MWVTTYLKEIMCFVWLMCMLGRFIGFAVTGAFTLLLVFSSFFTLAYLNCTFRLNLCYSLDFYVGVMCVCVKFIWSLQFLWVGICTCLHVLTCADMSMCVLACVLCMPAHRLSSHLCSMSIHFVVWPLFMKLCDDAVSERKRHRVYRIGLNKNGI